MLDSIQSKAYANSKSGLPPNYKPTTADENIRKTKLADDEEFYRIMELIRTEKADIDENPTQPEDEQPDHEENEEVSYFLLTTLIIALLVAKIIQVFQNIIMRVKELFDQSFPFIWSWMKSMTRGTYAVADGRVGLILLCVPLLTLFLFLYCSLLAVNAVTELLLTNAPPYVSQMVVTEKMSKMISRQKLSYLK